MYLAILQNDNYTSPNDYVQQLNGRASKVGTSIVLRVMSGDRVNIRASSWYRQNGVAAGDPQSALTDIVASLAEGIAGIAKGKTRFHHAGAGVNTILRGSQLLKPSKQPAISVNKT